MNALIRLAILPSAVIAFALAGGARAPAGEDETVYRIRELWRQRQQHWDRIYFECSGTGMVSTPEHSSPRHLKVWLDLSANQVRRELGCELFSSASGHNRFCKRFEVFLYDGRDIQTYEPREQNSTEGCELMAAQPELYLRTDESWFMLDQGDETPIFFAIGNVNTNWKNWRLPVEEGRFSRISTIQRDNREYQVLRSIDTTGAENFSELWVDVERDATVVRATIYSNGKPVRQVDVNHRQLHGAWLPSDWTASNLYPDGSVWRMTKLNVDRIDVNIDLSGTVFHMEPAVGMVVQDFALPGLGRWVLNADGTKKYVEIPRPRRADVLPETALATAVRWIQRRGPVLVSCGAILLVLASAWVSWWRHRKGH